MKPQGRRGGTIRELMTSYGPNQQAPGVPAEPVGLTPTQTTALRGFGQGASMGLIQYPQAALMSATNSDPSYSFKKALADLRADNERIAKESPYAWFSGNLTGGAATAISTGGSSLLGLAGRGAAQGAVSGFTEKESLADAGVGAGAGLVFGASGKLLNVGTNAMASKFAKEWVEPMRKMFPGKTDQEIATLVYTQEYSKYPTFKTFVDATKNTIKTGGKVIGEAAGPALGGAAVGATGAMLTGQSPVHGASAGAAVALSAAKLEAARQAGRDALTWAGGTMVRNPEIAKGLAPTAVNAATRIITPPLVGAVNPREDKEPVVQNTSPQVQEEKYPWEESGSIEEKYPWEK